MNVTFVHPLDGVDLRTSYRLRLLRLLDERLGFRFVFVGWDRTRLHEIPDVGLRDAVVLPDRSLGPYRKGVSGAVLRRAARDDYDVWFTSVMNWWPTHSCWPVVEARRKRFAIWLEDWWWPVVPGSRAMRAFDVRMLRSADAIVVAGSRARRFVVEESGADPRSVFVAPNATEDLGARPFDPARVARLRDEHAGSEALFLYLNRIVDYKGLDVLLRAWARAEGAGMRARLLVAGDGPLAASCEALARSLGLKRVAFIGSVPYDDIHLYYRASDLYVHPCRLLPRGRVRAEAWGFTVNEAMSTGTPVLATDAVAAAHDLIDEGTNGWMVPHDDVGALAEALIRAARDPEGLRRAGHAARATAERFTPEAQCDGFERAVAALGSGR